MNYKIVIPTRMGSSRLPGKPLKLISGMPMIWHVYQRALETNIGRDNIVIATDSEEIFTVASAFGAQVTMTSSEHKSGTDRCAEVAAKLGWGADEIVVNVQGDEPQLPAELIALTAKTLSDSVLAGIATLATPTLTQADLIDPNCVKLLTDRHNKAMLFSRSPMPQAFGVSDASIHHQSSQGVSPWLRHVGIYAYRVWTLEILSSLPETQIEKFERLEQLRAMWHGIHIQVACTNEAPAHGVDTQEDLDRVRELVSVRVA